MRKKIGFGLLLFFLLGCVPKDSSGLNFSGKWKFDKFEKVAGSLSKGKDVNDIYGKCIIEINKSSFSMCGEKTLAAVYKIVKKPTADRDPRLYHYLDSYQFGFGADRKEIIFFTVLSKDEELVELEYFENELIYYWDGFLIYFKKES